MTLELLEALLKDTAEIRRQQHEKIVVDKELDAMLKKFLEDPDK